MCYDRELQHQCGELLLISKEGQTDFPQYATTEQVNKDLRKGWQTKKDLGQHRMPHQESKGR
eukprot:2704357-Prorocentrum_lima.AAC.1